MYLAGASCEALLFGSPTVLTLYAVGSAAIVGGQLTAAVAAFAVGMIACAFGAWLSRGLGQGGPPWGGEVFDRRGHAAPRPAGDRLGSVRA